MTISVVQRVTTAQFIKLFGHLQTVPMEKKKGHVDVCSFFKIIFYFFLHLPTSLICSLWLISRERIQFNLAVKELDVMLSA